MLSGDAYIMYYESKRPRFSYKLMRISIFHVRTCVTYTRLNWRGFVPWLLENLSECAYTIRFALQISLRVITIILLFRDAFTPKIFVHATGAAALVEYC